MKKLGEKKNLSRKRLEIFKIFTIRFNEAKDSFDKTVQNRCHNRFGRAGVEQPFLTCKCIQLDLLTLALNND